jgi:carboxymethylenebutenolidase
MNPRRQLLPILLLLAASSSAPVGGLDAQEIRATVGEALPAGATDARSRLASSPRHSEWVMIPTGTGDSIRAWVVYPERRDSAPVVLVVHEIMGLSHWIRAVADQLAADGFIAVAPDLLTAYDVPEGADGAPDADIARTVIRSVDPDDVHRQLLAVARHAMALPAATESYGIVGFCWGGAAAFEHAIRSPGLGASIVYYGTSPEGDRLADVRVPVLGLYGEDDARVNATIDRAVTAMAASGGTFEHHIYPDAGHGFLRAQDTREGANRAATERAWPETVEWLRRYLEVTDL